MKNLISIILLIGVFACKNKHSENTEKETVYHIIQPSGYVFLDSLMDSTLPPPPNSPQLFYGNYNFVLVNKDLVYFYKARRVDRFYSVGFDDTKPEFLQLTKDSLTQIDVDSLQEFLERNITNKNINNEPISSIASPNDTIRNPAFKTIYDFLMNNGLNRFSIRKWTEEEQYVTQAKLRNIPYNPDSIQWKTKFGGSLIIPPFSED